MDLQNLTDPYIMSGTVKKIEGGYEWITVNGMVIRSVYPPLPMRWWDHRALHLIWSYSSWGTLLLAQAGTAAVEAGAPKIIGTALKTPRNLLKGRGWW